MRYFLILIIIVLCVPIYGAEFLIYNKEHWMDALTQEQIDVYKERQADNYIKWHNTKVALTSEQIDDILRPLVQKAKEHWIARHTEVLGMTQKDIDTECEEARVRFQAKYDARYQRGDVIEVRPDGYWTGLKAPGYDESVFLLVIVSGLKFEDASKYGKSLYQQFPISVLNEETGEFEEEWERRAIKKRKYNFSNVTDKQIFNNVSEISITEKHV